MSRDRSLLFRQSWETCFEIAIDLFTTPNLRLPDSRVRSFYTPLDYGKCTCEDIVRRQSRFNKWSEKYTLKILCLSPAVLGQALQLLRRDFEGLSAVLDHTEQLSLLFNLKEICECDRVHREPLSIKAENEWGLLDVKLINDKNGGTFKCSSLTPMLRSFDHVVRPTASVLKLAQAPSATTLRQKIDKEVEQTVLCKLKSLEHDDKPGCVYIMQRDSAPDYIKIGFSKKPAIVRNDNLLSCFSDLRVVTHTSKVPHAGRIEKLVHAELMYFRRAQDCGTCGKQHSEWFEIDIRIAKAVILRWSRWLALEPYKRIGGELKQDWSDIFHKKTVDNTATTVGRQLKPYLKPLRPAACRDDETEKIEMNKKRVQDVRMINVEKEQSTWYSPMKDKP